MVFTIHVGYFHTDTNGCIDSYRFSCYDGNCSASLTVFWKPKGIAQADRNLPVSGSKSSGPGFVKPERRGPWNIGLLWWWKLERGEGLWQKIVWKKCLKNSCVSKLKRKETNSPSLE